MAEAVLSLLASVGQLMDYTLKVCDYADQVRNAPTEKAAIAREAGLLFTTLTRLRHRVGLAQTQNNSSTEAWVSKARVFRPAVDELNNDLGRLVARLEHSRVLWPWDAKRCQATLARIERVQSILHLDLQESFIDITERNLTSVDQNVTKLVEDYERNWWKTLREFFSIASSSMTQQNIFERSLPGTGAWLLQHPTFLHWINTIGETLWCPGIPGAGKTIIASIIVNHLEQKFCHDGSVGIACIYFNYKETRSEIQLLSDIYLQLLQQHQTVPSLAKTYIERYQREGKRPTRGDLKDLVQSALKLYSRSFVVLDALDECIGDQDEPVERQAQFRKRLYETLQSFGLSVNLLVTSRVSGNIPQLFRDAMQLEISPHQNDMRAYIEQRIGEKGSSCQWTKMCQDDGGFKDQAVNTIIQKAQKMFLMVRLHVDTLIEQSRVRQVESALESLPTRLFDTYDQAMTRIGDQSADQRDRARRVLTWVAFATRPLTILELQHAEATAIGEFALDERDIQKIENLISCCAGLVVTDPGDQTVRFVHYTTQEYFQTSRQSHFPGAQKYLTQICLTYLQFQALEVSKNDWDRNRLRDAYPLISYAACYWGHHANDKGQVSDSTTAVEEDKEVQSLALSLLRKDIRVSDQFYVDPIAEDRNSIPPSRALWWQVSGRTSVFHIAEDRNSIPPPRALWWQVSGRPSGLHIAAGFGLESIMAMLLTEGLSLDLRDERGYTPLHRAVLNGRENTVRYLVEHGADVNAKDHWVSATPLMVAAVTGRLEIARYLLDQGAEVDAVATGGHSNATPLSEACHAGWADVTQLLLDRGAKTALGEDGYATWERWPMAVAASRGRADIIKLLLDKGCSLNGSNGYIALREAVRARSLVCLKALTTATAGATRTLEGEPTILEHAIFAGSWPMIQYLLQQRHNAPRTDTGLQPLVMAQLNRVSWFRNTVLTSEVCASPGSNTIIKRYRRDDQVGHDQHTNPPTYLGLVVPDDVTRVQKIVFRSDSHDQGWCDFPNSGNYTWFDASVQGRGEEDPYFEQFLSCNVLASAEWCVHETSWSCDSEVDAIASCVRGIAPGSVIQIMAKARFAGWVNYVRSFEVEIHHLASDL